MQTLVQGHSHQDAHILRKVSAAQLSGFSPRSPVPLQEPQLGPSQPQTHQLSKWGNCISLALITQRKHAGMRPECFVRSDQMRRIVCEEAERTFREILRWCQPTHPAAPITTTPAPPANTPLRLNVSFPGAHICLVPWRAPIPHAEVTHVWAPRPISRMRSRSRRWKAIVGRLGFSRLPRM